jgi:hypothetical protein
MCRIDHDSSSDDDDAVVRIHNIIVLPPVEKARVLDIMSANNEVLLRKQKAIRILKKPIVVAKKLAMSVVKKFRKDTTK